jgi:energy-coupling factor transporter ATP-binding protein EcfA2
VGKTTLLQVILIGYLLSLIIQFVALFHLFQMPDLLFLSTSGSINVQKYDFDSNPIEPPISLLPERVGIVFQFPER